MLADWIHAFSGWLSDHPGWLAMALLAAAFIESLAIAGLVVPGVALLFAIAVLAGETGMPVWQALAWTVIGAIAGDNISFWIGRACTGHLHRIWPFSRYPVVLDRGEQFFRKHGGKSVVIGRFIGPIRPVIPLVAGAFGMSGNRFLIFNLASALGWAPVYVLPGFLVGNAIARQIQLPPHIYLIAAVGGSIVVALYLLFFRLQWQLNTRSRAYVRARDWMTRYNATHRFWRLLSSQRPDSGGEFPLASIALALGSAVLFVIWTALNVSTDLLQPLNQQTLAFFGTLRQPLFDPLVVSITLLGNTAVMAFTTGIVALLLAFRGYYAAALHVLAACFATFVLVWSLKYGLDILRPQVDLRPPLSGAFPSGHATGITVLAGLGASFVAREMRSRWRWQIYSLFSLPILLVAISRLYLGVHWLTDVVGGILLGLSICGLVRASFSRYDQTHLSMDLSSKLAGLFWLAALAGYLILVGPDALVAYAPRPN